MPRLAQQRLKFPGRYFNGEGTWPPGRKKKRPGRRRVFDEQEYNHVKSMIERFNGRIRAFGRVATKFDRLPQFYTEFVHLACIMIYPSILQ